MEEEEKEEESELEEEEEEEAAAAAAGDRRGRAFAVAFAFAVAGMLLRGRRAGLASAGLVPENASRACSIDVLGAEKVSRREEKKEERRKKTGGTSDCKTDRQRAFFILRPCWRRKKRVQTGDRESPERARTEIQEVERQEREKGKREGGHQGAQRPFRARAAASGPAFLLLPAPSFLPPSTLARKPRSLPSPDLRLQWEATRLGYMLVIYWKSGLPRPLGKNNSSSSLSHFPTFVVRKGLR